MWHTYLCPTSVEQALDLLHQYADQARIVAGGTDVLVEQRRDAEPCKTLIDITSLHALEGIRDEGDHLILGALATHNDVLASAICQRHALPLVQACAELGAPQIRTRATLAGNIITAAPTANTTTPLVAMDADVVLASVAGERVIPLRTFYSGMHSTMIQSDELLREIRVPKLRATQRGLFLKLGTRRGQAKSLLNVTLLLDFDGPTICDARIVVGCVAPTVVFARAAAASLIGRQLDGGACDEAAQLACEEIAALDDHRATGAYRRALLAAQVSQGLRQLMDESEASRWAPASTPVLLETGRGLRENVQEATDAGAGCAVEAIKTTINGVRYHFPGAQRKTLLEMIRTDAGLIGTKSGCAEGECGSCTVWLNGQAVFSCLVPAAQAHGATITTVEGLSQGNELHPLQESFIAHGAVQCGYCTPGMLMTGAKLLQEHPCPSRGAARAALSGNICRCTGYRKILDAIVETRQIGDAA